MNIWEWLQFSGRTLVYSEQHSRFCLSTIGIFFFFFYKKLFWVNLLGLEPVSLGTRAP